MRVLYIIGQDAGGLPHYAAELANAISAYADVTVMKPRETTADDLFVPEVEVIDAFESLQLSMPKLYRGDVSPVDVVRGGLSYNELKRVAEMDVDVVHDTTGLLPYVKLFARLHRVGRKQPFVVTRHEVGGELSLSRPPHLVEELVDRAIPRPRVSHTVVHTENQKRALTAQGVPVSAIDVIPHGTYSVFGTHEDLDREPDPNTVLFFGNVVPHKGVESLVRAIPLVKQEFPDVRLVVAGDGDLPESVAPILAAHPENFEIHQGYIPNDEVKDFFGRATVVALTHLERAGKTNGHSGVFSTALSFGKPVVASTAGDFPERVAGGNCGRVFQAGDPESLAAALVEVLGDADLRAELAANSRRLGAELSWDAIARRHLALYGRLVGDELSTLGSAVPESGEVPVDERTAGEQRPSETGETEPWEAPTD